MVRLITIVSDTVDGKTVQQSQWSSYEDFSKLIQDIGLFLDLAKKKIEQAGGSDDDAINFHLDELNKLSKKRKIPEE